jgi:hypothetical protein
MSEHQNWADEDGFVNGPCDNLSAEIQPGADTAVLVASASTANPVQIILILLDNSP